MTVDRFLIRGVGSLDMPLRVLDLMTLQGATVYRAVIDKEGTIIASWSRLVRSAHS